MTAADEVIQASDHERCGCCGRRFARADVAELGNTPGVFVCIGCALSLARQPGPRAALRRLLEYFHALGGRLASAGDRNGPGPLSAIPILPTTDLDRTSEFYAAAGFTETERYDGYLLMLYGPVELHFSLEPSGFPAGQSFIHVTDAAKLWKQLRDRDVEGLGQVEDQDYGLREFVLTDPDGNHVRFGSPSA